MACCRTCSAWWPWSTRSCSTVFRASTVQLDTVLPVWPVAGPVQPVELKVPGAVLLPAVPVQLDITRMACCRTCSACWAGSTRTRSCSTACRASSVQLDTEFYPCDLLQDLFSLLSWEYPELFYSLPCQYNYQTHDDPTDNPEYVKWKAVYKNCSEPFKIIHRNGSN